MAETKDDDQDPLSLTLRHHFGITGKLGTDNVVFISDSSVLYPVGNHMGIFNLDMNSLSYFNNVSYVRSVHSLTVSSGREYVAIAERQVEQRNHHSSDEPSRYGVGNSVVSIYSLKGLNRVRLLNVPGDNNVISMSFSNDGKYLVTLEGAPRHSISYWKVSSGSCLETSSGPSGGTKVSVSPTDATMMIVTGKKYLKCWKLVKNELKMSTMIPVLREQETFVDQLWLIKNLVAVTDEGLILVFGPSETSATGYELLNVIKSDLPELAKVCSLARFKRGFVVAGTGGFLSIYEASDDLLEPFSYVKRIILGDIGVDSISISPDHETAAAHLREGYLVSFALGGIDIAQDQELEIKEYFREEAQVGAVTCMATCVQRTIFATGCTDKSVRIWNYKTKKCEASHHFTEDPTSVALHPAGFQIVVGTKERIQLHAVLHNDLKCLKEVTLKHCREIQYSHGGHYIACAVALNIVILKAYTCETIYTLAGHLGAVSRVTWSKDDLHLYSAGIGGGVYGWDMLSGRRIESMQHVVKQCKYAGIVADQNRPDRIVAAGSDGKIREIVLGEEGECIDVGSNAISHLLLSPCNNWLFASTINGSVMVFAWPALGPALLEIGAHRAAITKICVSPTGSDLLCASEDGSISMFQISYLVDTNSKKLITNSAAMINREDIEEMMFTITDSSLKLEQVKSDTEYLRHRQESEWLDRLRVCKEENEKLMSAERQRYDDLQSRHEKSMRIHGEDVTRKGEAHVRITQELENQYEHKLALEMSRNDILSEEMEAMRQRCETLLQTQESHHLGVLKHEREKYEKAMSDQKTVIAQLHEDLKYNEVKFEEILTQQETEYESELQSAKQDGVRQLKEEQQNIAIKEGQLTALLNKYEALKKKLQEVKATSHSRDIVLSTEKEKNAKLGDTLAHFEQHIEEREVILAEKEKNILRLRASNRTLDNFRFVLDHRVHQLQNDKGPMEEHVKKLETLIRDMHDELTTEFHRKNQIESELSSRDVKLKFLSKEVSTLRSINQDKDHSLSQLTRELARIAKLSHPKDIEDAVRDAYRVFVRGEKPRSIRLKGPTETTEQPSPKKEKEATKLNTTEDADTEYGDNLDSALGYDSTQVVKESTRQMGFLHQSLNTLQQTVKAQKAEAEKQRRSSVSQNSMLISECNRLRKANKEMELRMKELESNLRFQGNASGVNGSKSPLRKSQSAVGIEPATGAGSANQSNLSSRLAPISKVSSKRTRGMQQIQKQRRGNAFSKKSGENLSPLLQGSNGYDEQLCQQQREISRLRNQMELIMSQKVEDGLESELKNTTT